jgi:hypothetical protein
MFSCSSKREAGYSHSEVRGCTTIASVKAQWKTPEKWTTKKKGAGLAVFFHEASELLAVANGLRAAWR